MSIVPPATVNFNNLTACLFCLVFLGGGFFFVVVVYLLGFFSFVCLFFWLFGLFVVVIYCVLSDRSF